MPTTTPQRDISPRRKGAVLALAVLALVAMPAAAQETVSLMAVDSEFDLGTLTKGEVVEHAFVLRNTGQETVTIDRLAHSCGCTVAEYDDTIPAGGEGTVRAEIDTMTLNGKGSSSIEVYAGGAEAPVTTLVLRYNVVPRLLAHPGYARWNYVQHEEQGLISQTVYSTDGAEFDVVRVEPPMPSIDVSFRPAEGDELQEGFAGSQWRLEATLATDAPVGPLTGYITVHTTHPEQEEMRIPVSGFVRPALFLQPPELDFGTLELASVRHAPFDLRNFATEAIHATGASTDLPGVTARVEPVEEGRRYRRDGGRPFRRRAVHRDGQPEGAPRHGRAHRHVRPAGRDGNGIGSAPQISSTKAGLRRRKTHRPRPARTAAEATSPAAAGPKASSRPRKAAR